MPAGQANHLEYLIYTAGFKPIGLMGFAVPSGHIFTSEVTLPSNNSVDIKAYHYVKNTGVDITGEYKIKILYKRL